MRALQWLYAITVFVSAFLLFQIQPIIGKIAVQYRFRPGSADPLCFASTWVLIGEPSVLPPGAAAAWHCGVNRAQLPRPGGVQPVGRSAVYNENDTPLKQGTASDESTPCRGA